MNLENYAKWKKEATKGPMLYDSTYSNVQTDKSIDMKKMKLSCCQGMKELGKIGSDC